MRIGTRPLTCWPQQPFFARYDPEATWLDQLEPAFGEERFFFEDEFDVMQGERVKARRIA